MTRAEFRTIVIAYVKQGNAGYIADLTDTEINQLLNRGLKSWSEWTYSIYDDDQTLSIGIGSGLYTTSPMFQVERVFVDGIPMINTQGQRGSENRLRFYNAFPEWKNRDDAKPQIFIPFPQNQIRIYPAPDVSTYDVKMAGFKRHDTIDTSASGDTVEITVEDAYVDMCALWVTIFLQYPAASGPAALSRIQALDAIAYKKLREYRERNLGRIAGKRTIGRPLGRIRLDGSW